MATGVSALALGGLILLLNWNSSPRTPLGKGGGNEELLLYCAAGIRKPVEAVVKEYQAAYGVKINPVFAGSGALLASIRAASKGDLYLAADATYLEDARTKYRLVRETVPLARQRPVIAVQKGNPKKIVGLDDLARDDVRTSLADPEVAAVSKVSRLQLSDAERWDAIWNTKRVSRSTVNEVANDVKMATVDAGIAWDATVSQYPELEGVSVPEFEARPNQITIGVLSTSEQPTRALHFMRFLSARDKGLVQFKKFGYDAVDGDRWAETPEIKLFCGGLNRPAVEKTIEAFQQREGVTVLADYNGCGVLVGQMRTGLIPDVYFACDTSFMEMVEEDFSAPRDVSSTEMVIITQKGNPKDVNELKDLMRPGLKVGLCNPEKSALGELCQRLLTRHQLWRQVYPEAKDQPATADILVQHVVIGSLDAAIVYRANTTLQREELEAIDILDTNTRATQPIAVAKTSQYKQLTSRLMERIRSAQSEERFRSLGFNWLGESATP